MLVLNWMDFTFILLLVVGMLIGYVQGLLRQIIALAALYLGAILAAQYFHFLSNGLKSVLPTTPGVILNAAAFFIILFLVMIILNILGRDAFNVKLNLIPWLNHLGGMVLGLVMAWIILTLAVNILSFTTGVQMWSVESWGSTEAWQRAEDTRLLIHDGLTSSLLVGISQSTFPAILASIRPWLPAGMPAIFEM